MQTAYTQKHERRLALYRAGKNDREIANELGENYDAIQSWRQRNGLKVNSEVITDNRMELYTQGLSDRETARRLGLNHKSITNWRHKNGLKPNFEPKTVISSETSICWSCARARALPDPFGCAFHRRERKPIFSAAVVADRRNNGTEYKSVTVTECEFWELSIRDMRDRAKIVCCE